MTPVSSGAAGTSGILEGGRANLPPGCSTPARRSSCVDDDVVMASGETGRDAVLRCFTWADGHADVWRVFDDGGAFASVIEDLVAPWRGHDITKVCGVESRGFILGGAVAGVLGTGFVAIRKRGGLFPGPKLEVGGQIAVHEQDVDGRSELGPRPQKNSAAEHVDGAGRQRSQRVFVVVERSDAGTRHNPAVA